MAIMKHPNGCVHDVREDLVEKFTKAGWKPVKAARSEQPSSPAEQEKPKSKAKAKK